MKKMKQLVEQLRSSYKENEEMVKWILDTLPFEAEELSHYIPKKLALEKEEVKRLTKGTAQMTDNRVERCSIQLLPGFMESDGFFFARLRRKQ